MDTFIFIFTFTIAAASSIVALIAVKTYSPFAWTDVKYVCEFLRVLVRFVSRRRRTPRFFALDRFLEQSAARPDKVFVVFEHERFTYAEADARSNRLARALRSQRGYRPGDTVALFMGNEPAFLFTCLALAKLGSPAALLNHNIRSKSLLHGFSCSGATVLIGAPELRGAVEDVLPSLTQQGVTVLLMTDHCPTPGIVSFAEKVNAEPDLPLPRSLRSHVTFKSPAVYIYTSGTTGLPKAAVVNQTRLLAALAVLSSNGVTSEDVIYLNLPLYHTAGFIIGFIGSIETGSTIVLRRKFSASQFWDDCRKHNVTVIQYIGEVMRYLCSTAQRENDKDHKVRLAIGNGIRAEVWREFLRRFGNVQIREFYASTEGNVGFVNYAGKIGAIGRVNLIHKTLFPFVLIKYDTERDAPVRGANGLCVQAPKGETGLLVSKITDIAPFEGYSQNEEQTERKRLRDVLRRGDLYFNSGDLMRIDQDNFIYFQDRVGDTFRWKGENVATTEVSDILTICDCIKEANVYGVQVPGHEGRIGMAAVTLKEDTRFDGGKVYGHVVEYLPPYARPRFIRIQGAVEVTGTFKQIKVKLVGQGFDPGQIQDQLFVLEDREKSYVTMTTNIFNSIVAGHTKL
ncbi:long-chain fatty acid transport protein 2-like [Eucyclogobius newberryi]|uniref:long-chain fatty acid transport protein 2-like n=1 Tax=Eucyclogobius newberryi TaxID=166745 RepID=UPI003B597C91